MLVKKKARNYRMCIDYRGTNALVVKDKYPLPFVEDQIDCLEDNWFFIIGFRIWLLSDTNGGPLSKICKRQFQKCGSLHTFVKERSRMMLGPRTSCNQEVEGSLGVQTQFSYL